MLGREVIRSVASLDAIFFRMSYTIGINGHLLKSYNSVFGTIWKCIKCGMHTVANNTGTGQRSRNKFFSEHACPK